MWIQVSFWLLVADHASQLQRTQRKSAKHLLHVWCKFSCNSMSCNMQYQNVHKMVPSKLKCWCNPLSVTFSTSNCFFPTLFWWLLQFLCDQVVYIWQEYMNMYYSSCIVMRRLVYAKVQTRQTSLAMLLQETVLKLAHAESLITMHQYSLIFTKVLVCMGSWGLHQHKHRNNQCYMQMKVTTCKWTANITFSEWQESLNTLCL